MTDQQWYEIVHKIEELQHKVKKLEEENQNLKQQIIAISPLYPEEQRIAAMEKANENIAREAESERLRSMFH